MIIRPETGVPVPQQQGLSGAAFVAMMYTKSQRN